MKPPPVPLPEDGTAAAALAHTLAIYDHTGRPDNNTYVVQATANAYGPGIATGLTWGDLRDLHQQIAGVQALVARWRREAAEQGPDDALPTAAAVAMLDYALNATADPA